MTKQSFLPFLDTDAMVAESIEYLRIHEPPEGYYVGFSGGKDSICTLELCRMAGVKFTAYYSCTRIDPPEVVKFVRENYPEVVFLFPKMTFWAGIKKKGPPFRFRRWCCDVLKKDPGLDIPLNHRVMGIRSEESSRRAAYPRTDYYKKYRINLYKPVFFWNEYHVWNFIENRGLECPDLYSQGFHRLGCVICPFNMGKSKGKKAARDESMRRWPGLWKAFRSSCYEWYVSARKSGHDERFENETFDEYYEAYLNGFE